MGQDPTWFTAGDSNLYRYVFDDPVNDVDPSGLQDPAPPPPGRYQPPTPQNPAKVQPGLPAPKPVSQKSPYVQEHSLGADMDLIDSHFRTSRMGMTQAIKRSVCACEGRGD